jgi:hypothetical protein
MTQKVDLLILTGGGAELLQKMARTTAGNDLLQRAASVVLREALDDITVHPCDEGDDRVSSRQLPMSMQQLLFALTGYETPGMAPIENLPPIKTTF